MFKTLSVLDKFARFFIILFGGGGGGVVVGSCHLPIPFNFTAFEKNRSVIPSECQTV